MTTNLSQKLFTQKDGKRFAYADDIKKAVKELMDLINREELIDWDDFIEEIKEIFGKELTQ